MTMSVSLPVRIAILVVMVLLSALFAGLTLGVMAVNEVTLEIIANAGTEPHRTHAKTVQAVRAEGHRTLCTLVIGNMFVNVLIANICDDFFPQSILYGFLLTTAIVLIFCEVLPMSLCKSRFSLRLAASGVPLLIVFMVLLYPLAAPLGWLLDRLLGHGPGQIYDRQQMRRFMLLHARASEDLQSSEIQLILATLGFNDLLVRDRRTPPSKAVTLAPQTVVDRNFISELWRLGHSRLPVVDPVTQHVHGMLHVRDLLGIDPQAGLCVSAFAATSLADGFVSVNLFTPLPELLELLCRHHSQMAVIVDEEEPGKFQGLITLEDLTEQMIQDEILDEFDRGEAIDLTVFDQGRGAHKLEEVEVQLIANYLSHALPLLGSWSLDDLLILVRAGTLRSFDPEPGHPFELIAAGSAMDSFYLVLQGEIVLIAVGMGELETHLRKWRWLGESVLDPSFLALTTRLRHAATILVPTLLLQLPQALIHSKRTVVKSTT